MVLIIEKLPVNNSCKICFPKLEYKLIDILNNYLNSKIKFLKIFDCECTNC